MYNNNSDKPARRPRVARAGEGGYSSARREGGYQSRSSEGGFGRREGGYQGHRSEGGFQGRRSEGGYSRRGEGRFASNRSEGFSPRRERSEGFSPREGRPEGFAPRRNNFGGHRPEGGFQGHRSEGGFQGRRSEGGYQGRRSEGGFQSRGNNYGPKKSFGPRPQRSSALDGMIAKKDQEFISKVSAKPVKEPMAQEEVRLNKFVANSGVCSRREADNLIQAGVITINGVVVTELGTKVNIYKDEVRYDGQLLKGEDMVYLVMNKPSGYVTSASDPHAEKTVYDLIRECKTRVFPVGRLDKNTTGVLLFTNDGQIAERLTHPSYDKKKIYQVSLDSKLSQEDYDKLLAGIELEDGIEAADELEYIDPEDHRKVGIEIHSGKNRIVRRMFESMGYRVKALDRVYFAGLTKKGVKKGEWRYLTEGEVNILKMGAYI